jgi:peptide/nickel transport system substrate-binding protein
MKKQGLIAIAAMTLMMIPLFSPGVRATAMSDSHTFFEGTIGWGPVSADPATCYDSVSGELIFNSYENLIAWSGEYYYAFTPVLATNNPTRQDITLTAANMSAVGVGDPTGSTWTDGAKTYTCVGWVDQSGDGLFSAGDVVYLTDGTSWRTWTVDALTGTSTVTLNLWRGSYVFNIRTSPTIYFYNERGVAVDTFDVTDAQYSFQRALVQDQVGSPVWMYDKPLFDQQRHSHWTDATAMSLAHLIGNAVEADTIANTLTINVGIRFPDTAFKQILANTWGAIGSKEFSVSIGCWDGNLYTTAKYGGPFPDWWIDWNDVWSSPYDTGRRYCGTGPYYVQTVDSVNTEVILRKNPGYWRGWPAMDPYGNPCNGSLDTIDIKYMADWSTRLITFEGGFLDTCVVPRADMFMLLDSSGEPTGGVAAPIKTIKNIAPTLSMDVMMFNFNISSLSPYIGTGSFPGGIPTNFFNNTHVRRAFAYAFNTTQYNQQVFYGESAYRKNFLVSGLVPDYYNDSVPGYDINYLAAYNELTNAIFGQPPQSVWRSGFTVDLMYNTGDDVRMIACYAIRNFFQVLSSQYPGAGTFTVNVLEVSWAALVEGVQSRTLPMWDASSPSDFADADDSARAYMYSTGAYAQFQDYTAANGWDTTKDRLIDQALLMPDGGARQALYNQLQTIYYNDCPSFPLDNPTGRFWCNYWVKGWYFDTLYPGAYYYTMWKQDSPWYDVSGSTPGVSDGMVNMKDVAYLTVHFNAKAPSATITDPKWIGVYGANGCVDPYGDRVCNMKDIAGTVAHFNKNAPGNP